MPRPRKFRNIVCRPGIIRFVPVNGRGVGPASVLELEELEAIRLKDIEGLDQTTCAERMQISRPTFQRILIIARRKIAIALVEGNEIMINPNYEFETTQVGQGRGMGLGQGRGQGRGMGQGRGQGNGGGR